MTTFLCWAWNEVILQHCAKCNTEEIIGIFTVPTTPPRIACAMPRHSRHAV